MDFDFWQMALPLSGPALAFTVKELRNSMCNLGSPNLA